MSDNQNNSGGGMSTFTAILILVLILGGIGSCTSCLGESSTSQYDTDLNNALDKWDRNYDTRGMTPGEKRAFDNYIDWHAKQLK